MKAGTTSLFDLLVRHPQICGSMPKEPEFFSSEQSHDIGCDNYSDLYAFDPSRHLVCLEASTGYSKFPMEQGVPERIAAAGLKPLFIYVTRDPVKRFISHLSHMGINPERMSSGQFETVLATSCYHLQASRFANVFGKESILIVDFSDVLHETQKTVGMMLAHLGLPEADFDMSLPHSNESRTTLRHWIKLSRTGGLYDLLPRSVDHALNSLILKHIPMSARFRLNADMEADVRGRLRDDVQKLRDDLGFEAPWMEDYLTSA